MKIEKKLKNYTWLYNSSSNSLLISNNITGGSVVIDKIRMYSLARFIIRVSQRLSKKERKHEEIT